MLVTEITDNDTRFYKKPSLYVATAKCSFKCDRECGEPICSEYSKAGVRGIHYTPKQILNKYISSLHAEALVFGGMEPFDSAIDLYLCIKEFRAAYQNVPIIIWSGYTPDELNELGFLTPLLQFPNIIIKFGRYVPDDKPHYDQLLGVRLASRNQRAYKLEVLVRSIVREHFIPTVSKNGKKVGRPKKKG